MTKRFLVSFFSFTGFVLFLLLVPQVFAARDLQLSPELKKALGDNIHNYHALVIGNNDYLNLPKLKTAVNDAEVVAEALRDQYGFKTRLLLNATRAEIIRSLSHYRKTLTRKDNLLIYYAGHGWLDEAGDSGYWLPVDATTEDDINWVSNSSITSKLKAMLAKHVLVVADSCYSGKLARGISIKKKTPDYITLMFRKKARLVLASGGLEPVSDSGGKGNHSVFATAFIDALRENTGVMDGTELFSKIRRPVMLNSDQTPEYADIRKAGHDGGDFIFIRTAALESATYPEGASRLESTAIPQTEESVEYPGLSDLKKKLAEIQAKRKRKERENLNKQKEVELLAKIQAEELQLKELEERTKILPSTTEGMVFIKGGCFDMGDTFGEGSSNEKPVHEVCVDDFYLGEHEVTQGEWKEIMGNNPAYFKSGDDYPVETVSYDDIQEFTRKLNRKTGKRYRLPTEAEWEYAARERGKKVRYAGGFSNENDLQRYANLCDVNCKYDWKKKNQDDGFKETSPVKRYKPNSLGLYDMSGNVWEWVSDWHDDKYYKNSPRSNPSDPNSGKYRVLRGGSWNGEPDGLRAANRYRNVPTEQFNAFGFRLAVSVR